MRLFLIVAAGLALAVVAVIGFGYWRYEQLFPKASTEVVQLTPEKRVLIQRLRAETKFLPNDFPPFGYTGAETPADQEQASAAVNSVLDAVLALSDGPIRAAVISGVISRSMREVDELATEDRDRTQGYMLEVWYILGFKGATGLFAYGSAFPMPDGYEEPLPPGWTAPSKPRPIP